MNRRDGAEMRRQRIAQITKMVHAALHASKNGEIPLSKFLATVMYKTGLTKEKIIEYLEVPQEMEQFEIDSINDKIRYPSKSV